MNATITVEGNLTTDPRLNCTATGKPVANLRIAVSSRRKGRDGEYADTPAVFYDVTVWGAPAEHAAESLSSGDRVLVTGATWSDTYTDTAGDERTKNVIEADAIAVSLRYHTATPVKPTRTKPAAAATADAGAVEG